MCTAPFTFQTVIRNYCLVHCFCSFKIMFFLLQGLSWIFIECTLIGWWWYQIKKKFWRNKCLCVCVWARFYHLLNISITKPSRPPIHMLVRKFMWTWQPICTSTTINRIETSYLSCIQPSFFTNDVRGKYWTSTRMCQKMWSMREREREWKTCSS